MGDLLMQTQLVNHPVAGLIPHRGPMHLVDHILWVDREKIRGEVSAIIREGRPYFGEFGFEMHWLIELSAQASAAIYRMARHDPNDAPSNGYLISVRHFDLPSERVLQPGDELKITVEFEVESTPLGQSRCQVSLNGEILGLGELTFLLEA
jgi:predicted hotdog family 3-hydroxylacyl-ACP dehydratase